jgi:catechol 2,3-dioxygenase-like lactoylglutathione lyase family enzyme
MYSTPLSLVKLLAKSIILSSLTDTLSHHESIETENQLKINIDHILLVVKDLENTISFYRHLGFTHEETINRPKDRVGIIKKDNMMVELMQLPEGHETYREPRKNSDIGFRHIGFRVEDIHEVYESLKDKIQFDGPPVRSAGRGDRKLLFFKDPDGVELHFIQE